MKVLVIGAHGKVAQHLIQNWLKSDIPCTAAFTIPPRMPH